MALAAVLGIIGCEAAKSSNPTSPSVAGPIPGVNITQPKPLEPYAGTQLKFTGEPQTLLIENAGTSGNRAIWLQLDVATDATFTQIVHQNDRIELGSNGRTSYRLPSALAAGNTYYWRSRANDGANVGPYSDVSSFAVIIPVLIEPPAPILPSGMAGSNKPEFKVANAAISGTSGVAYRFEVSKTADFSQIAAVVTVPVNGNGITSMSLGELPYKTTFFWRVMGSDTVHASDYSMVMSFTTPNPPAPPPSAAPANPPGVPADSALWTDDQWKAFFFSLVAQKGGPTVSIEGMRAMRGDILSRGGDFQNGWRGDMRPRLFLPVPGCPPANNPSVPNCSYGRTVDLGNWGGAWAWDFRGPT